MEVGIGRLPALLSPLWCGSPTKPLPKLRPHIHKKCLAGPVEICKSIRDSAQQPSKCSNTRGGDLAHRAQGCLPNSFTFSAGLELFIKS